MATKGKFKKDLHITEELLIKEWIENRLSQSEIAKKYNVSLSTIESRIKSFGLIGRRDRTRYTLDESKLSIEDPIFCYYLGLVVTDGYINGEKGYVSLRLANVGAEVLLSKIKNYFNYTGQVRCYTIGSTVSYDLTICSIKLINVLLSLNIQTRAKTYDINYLKITNLDNKAMFFRGILDGDGSLHVQSNEKNYLITFRIVMASIGFMQEFLEDINNTLSLEIVMRQHKRQAEKLVVYYPKIEMKKQETKTFLNFLYKGWEEYRLPLKYDRYLLIKDEDIVHT